MMVKSSLVASSGPASRRLSSLLRVHHVLEHLVDGVLVLTGPRRDHPPHFAADARDEAGRLHVAGVLRAVGKQLAQVAVVEVRVLDAVVPALPR